MLAVPTGLGDSKGLSACPAVDQRLPGTDAEPTQSERSVPTGDLERPLPRGLGLPGAAGPPFSPLAFSRTTEAAPPSKVGMWPASMSVLHCCTVSQFRLTSPLSLTTSLREDGPPCRWVPVYELLS